MVIGLLRITVISFIKIAHSQDLQRIYVKLSLSPFGCIYRPGKDMDHRRYRRRLAVVITPPGS